MAAARVWCKCSSPEGRRNCKTRGKGLEHLQSKVRIRRLQVFSVVPSKKSCTIQVWIEFLMTSDWQMADVLSTLGALGHLGALAIVTKHINKADT